MAQSVVRVQEIEPEIVQITMEDREFKNTFSKDLIAGLSDAYAAIEANSTYKVVILTGYGNYFASGGTHEGLLAIYEGKEKFTDTNIYSLALDCKIPVISAMSGHAIGGGFAMGLFSDFVIMSRECVYTTNFMKYGFTPGMGATLILPYKLGFSLAQEMLMSAGTYRGADLEKRGIPFAVVPRAEVMDRALDLARQLAEKPRISLMTLKEHLVAPLRAKLQTVIQQEVAMHEKTFHREEVRDRINVLFGK